MRIAFIGDVHGHATAFMKLLRRLEDYGVDEIVQVGDLVDRGPDSIECVRIARTWTFTARGNRRGESLEGGYQLARESALLHSVSEAEAHGGSRRYPPRVEGEAPD